MNSLQSDSTQFDKKLVEREIANLHGERMLVESKLRWIDNKIEHLLVILKKLQQE